MKILRAIFFFVFYLSLSLSAQEIKEIKVISDDNYPPYIFKDHNGNLQGITYDLWKIWEKKTGIKVNFIATDWAIAKEKFNNHEADVMETVFITEERKKIYIFSKAYAQIRVPVYYRQEISGIKDIDDLKGFTVGVKAGDACIDFLKSKSIDSFKEYSSYEEIIKAVAKKQVHIFCIDEPCAIYYMHKYKLLNEVKLAFNINTGQFHRAVHKENPALLSLVEKGFEQIDQNEIAEIEQKWLGQKLYNEDFKKYYPIFLVFLAVIFYVILMLYGINRYLKKQINKKTLDLQTAIDQLSRSESRIKAFLNINPDMIFVFNATGDFIDYSCSDTNKLYAPPELFIGKNVYDVLPKAIADLTLNKIHEVIKTKELQTYEYSLIMNDHEEFYEARMFIYAENEFISIVRHITDKKIREIEQIQTNKLESLGTLAGGIAHDFNNILTSIIGSLSILKMRLSNDAHLVEIIDTAVSASDRAKYLSNQLLTFSKGGDPVKVNANINSLLQETTENSLRGSNIKCDLYLESKLSNINFDKDQMIQVFENIIFNAAQSMPEGGKISIKTQNIQVAKKNKLKLKEEEYIVIEICDHGKGINPEILEKIFDPYYSTKAGRSGLGLSIAYSIIQKHNGLIKVHSELDRGTCFSIYLPVSQEKREKKMLVEENKTQTDGNKKKRVLLMDDEKQILFIGKEMLEFLGYEASVCENGEEALKLLSHAIAEENPYDIIIMDLTIPAHMGGKEAIEHIREEGFQIKCIVSSGYSNDPIIANYEEYGFDGYLTKPFDLDLLKNSINAVL